MTRRAASLKMKGQSIVNESQLSNIDSSSVSGHQEMTPKKSNWQVIEHFATDCSTHSPNLIAVSCFLFFLYFRHFSFLSKTFLKLITVLGYCPNTKC